MYTTYIVQALIFPSTHKHKSVFMGERMLLWGITASWAWFMSVPGREMHCAKPRRQAFIHPSAPGQISSLPLTSTRSQLHLHRLQSKTPSLQVLTWLFRQKFLQPPETAREKSIPAFGFQVKGIKARFEGIRSGSESKVIRMMTGGQT